MAVMIIIIFIHCLYNVWQCISYSVITSPFCTWQTPTQDIKAPAPMCPLTESLPGSPSQVSIILGGSSCPEVLPLIARPGAVGWALQKRISADPQKTRGAWDGQSLDDISYPALACCGNTLYHHWLESTLLNLVFPCEYPHFPNRGFPCPTSIYFVPVVYQALAGSSQLFML